MGGVLAAALTSAGERAVLVDVNRALVDTVRSSGLVIDETAEGTSIMVRPEATTDPSEIGPVETAVFLVKGYHTAPAAALAKPLVDSSTAIVTLQNGWGNAEVLAQAYPLDQIVIGVLYHSATVLELGHVAHTANGPAFVGPYQPGGSMDRAEAVRGLLSRAGMEVTATPQIRTEVWKKLIHNAAALPTAALTGLRTGTMGHFEAAMQVVDALAREAVQTARAQGFDIDLQERIDRIHTSLQGAGVGKASMLQDVEARRKTEIDTINGAVVRAAEEHGVDVPLNRAMVHLVKGLERSWEQ
jgi:2-dehydropantoate 2-reductase